MENRDFNEEINIPVLVFDKLQGDSIWICPESLIPKEILDKLEFVEEILNENDTVE